MDTMKITAPRVLFDVFLLFILPYAGVYMDNHWIPPRPGIRCKDPSLSYPKKDNTISPKQVTFVSAFLPLVVFLLYDVAIYKRRWACVYQNIVTFLTGIDLVFVTNNLVKYNLGWPRPYFLEACDPDYSEIDCRRSYILDPHCQGDAHEIKWASLTFPSLHSSSTAFGMTYILIFLSQNYNGSSKSYIKNMCSAIIQCSAITWFIFVAVSRVNDHRHHVIDVIAGSVWGFTFSLILVYRCSGLFSQDNKTTQDVRSITPTSTLNKKLE